MLQLQLQMSYVLCPELTMTAAGEEDAWMSRSVTVSR